MKKKKWIFHIEFAVVLIIICSIFAAEYTREIPVSVDVDYSSLQHSNMQLESGIERLISLHDLYETNLEKLQSFSTSRGLDRLSSQEVVVGRVFYIEGEAFYYCLPLTEYLKAEENMLLNSASKVDKTYVRPLTPDIKFLGKQFIERYPDKTERALAILHLIQNLKFKENEDVVKHPTVTLMEGGSSLDLTIACGALLKAADIDCAMLIFKNSSYAIIGISNIIFENLPEKLNKNTITEFNGQKYLIVDIVLSQNLGGSENGSQGSVTPENIELIIPYEFP